MKKEVLHITLLFLAGFVPEKPVQKRGQEQLKKRQKEHGPRHSA
jgi:hypothetical protein